MTAEEKRQKSIAIAEAIIGEENITDPDTIQDIYLIALQSTSNHACKLRQQIRQYLYKKMVEEEKRQKSIKIITINETTINEDQIVKLIDSDLDSDIIERFADSLYKFL